MHVFSLNNTQMTRKTPLPHALVRLVLSYEGSLLKAYVLALIRRLSVRCYQSLYTRRFKFYTLKHYSIHHLLNIVQTELLCVQRFGGRTTTRVYRKSLDPWVPWIHTLKMRQTLNKQVRHLLFKFPPGHPLFRVQSTETEEWLRQQTRLIVGP